MNQIQKKKLKYLKDNYQYYAKSLLKIKTKDNQLIPFEFNKPQIRLNSVVDALENALKPVRIILLKARQLGFSTWTEGKIFHKTAMKKLVDSGIIAHKDDASTNLFNMSKLFYDSLPPEFKPMKKASNAKEIIFQNPTKDEREKELNPGLKSRIRLSTAGDREAGRSSTYQYLHVSEIAFWPDAKTTMTALMQTVPDHSDTMVVVESTANGVGDYFHELWTQAKEGANDFIPLFFPWYEFDEYSMAAPEDMIVTTDEQELKDLYKLTNDQLYWRRWCIKNKCGGDEEIFQQEYPSDDLEAFLMSGRPRFSRKALQYYRLNRLIEPRLTGDITSFGVEPNDKGHIKFYQKKKKHGQYVISSDVAEGLEHGDRSINKVFDLETLELIAEWAGHCEPAELGTHLYYMGIHWNNAYIVVERNNHGLATIVQLKNVHLYPTDLIFESNYASENADDDFKNPEKRYGWLTTQTTKKLIIDHLGQMIAKHLIPHLSKEDISELQTYIREANGKTNAEKNCWDDRCMAMAIFYYVVQFIEFKLRQDWETCSNCEYHSDGKCSETERTVDSDDWCRLFAEIYFEIDDVNRLQSE